MYMLSCRKRSKGCTGAEGLRDIRARELTMYMPTERSRLAAASVLVVFMYQLLQRSQTLPSLDSLHFSVHAATASADVSTPQYAGSGSAGAELKRVATRSRVVSVCPAII